MTLGRSTVLTVRRQHESSSHTAFLDACVCPCYVFQNVRADHDRPNHAAGNESERVLELRARGAVHAQHRLVAEEQLRRIEANESAGDLPHENPSPVNAEDEANRVEERRTYVDEVDIR